MGTWGAGATLLPEMKLEKAQGAVRPGGFALPPGAGCYPEGTGSEAVSGGRWGRAVSRSAFPLGLETLRISVVPLSKTGGSGEQFLPPPSWGRVWEVGMFICISPWCPWRLTFSAGLPSYHGAVSQATGKSEDAGPVSPALWGHCQGLKDLECTGGVLRLEMDSWSPRGLLSTAQTVAMLASSREGEQ